MSGKRENGIKLDTWSKALSGHGFLVAAIVCVLAIVVIVALAETNLNVAIIAALIALIGPAAGGVINFTHLEPRKDKANLVNQRISVILFGV